MNIQRPPSVALPTGAQLPHGNHSDPRSQLAGLCDLKEDLLNTLGEGIEGLSQPGERTAGAVLASTATISVRSGVGAAGPIKIGWTLRAVDLEEVEKYTCEQRVELL